MKLKLYTLLFSVALVCVSAMMPARAQTLQGRVVLGDTLPASYATVYVPSTGQGTSTDADGYYRLDDVSEGHREVEFSFLGYRTARRGFDFARGRSQTHDERLDEQPLSLNEVFVTPDGKDPALYILGQVAARAEVNRKRLTAYDATVLSVFHAHDIDFFRELLPGAVDWLIRAAVRTIHMGAIYDFCTLNERVDVRLSAVHHYAKGKTRYAEQRVLSSTPVMPDKAQRQLFELMEDELFDKLYGKELDYGSKALKQGKCKYRLKGTIEEQGRVIDVLEAVTRYDTLTFRQVVYVIEDNWGILRKEMHSAMGYERVECRDIGGGIYMPISKVVDPKLIQGDVAKMLRDAFEKKKAKGEKLDRSERKMMERLENFIATGRAVRPSMTSSYNIQYRNVSVK